MPARGEAGAHLTDTALHLQLSEHWGEEYDVLSDSILESVGGNAMSTLQDSDQSATPNADHAVELGGEATSTRPGSAKSDDRGELHARWEFPPLSSVCKAVLHVIRAILSSICAQRDLDLHISFFFDL